MTLSTSMQLTINDQELIRKIDSITKYPSIPTYHEIGDKGILQEKISVSFTPEDRDDVVFLTEKIDGTNARLIVLPDSNDYFIGARDHLVHARGDRVINDENSIVSALRLKANQIADNEINPLLEVYYFEVFGGKIGQAAKQYTSQKETSFRLFDYAYLHREEFQNQLGKDLQSISRWRETVGPEWMHYANHPEMAEALGIECVPYLDAIHASDLPITVDETPDFMRQFLDRTNVALDQDAKGEPEGVVLRASDRSVIAKMRFEDYNRTLKKR